MTRVHSVTRFIHDVYETEKGGCRFFPELLVEEVHITVPQDLGDSRKVVAGVEKKRLGGLDTVLDDKFPRRNAREAFENTGEVVGRTVKPACQGGDSIHFRGIVTNFRAKHFDFTYSSFVRMDLVETVILKLDFLQGALQPYRSRLVGDLRISEGMDEAIENLHEKIEFLDATIHRRKRFGFGMNRTPPPVEKIEMNGNDYERILRIVRAEVISGWRQQQAGTGGKGMGRILRFKPSASLQPQAMPWNPHKARPLFADMLSGLRCVLWKHRILANSGFSMKVHEMIKTLSYALSNAA